MERILDVLVEVCSIRSFVVIGWYWYDKSFLSRMVNPMVFSLSVGYVFSSIWIAI